MRIGIVFLAVLLSACISHKMEVRQGNLITPEMREKVALGMPRAQVRFVLGTPLLSDPFHANRWDYVYRLEQAGKLVEQQRLTLYFDGDRLSRIDDSGMPAAVRQ